MPKIADKYFKCEPWQVVEAGFDASRGRVSESVFSLANEALGVRGYFDEGYSGDSLVGSYINGIWELDENLPHSYRGVITKTHFMAAAVNWLYTRLTVGGETLDLNVSNFSDFSRTLDMKGGKLYREFVWHSPKGNIRLKFTRFLDMTRGDLGYQSIDLTADADVTLDFESGLDFSVKHEMYNRCLWNEVKSSDGEITAETKVSKQRVKAAFSLNIPAETVLKPLYSGKRASIELKKGEMFTIIKTVSINGDVSSAKDYGAAFAANDKYWAERWKQADIIIDGDEENQQGIRFCVFQMEQTFRGDAAGHNIGAKGLTGEAYNGHAFWDTEVCCLPYYLFSNPQAAKNLLEFRRVTLPQAKNRAKELDCDGACYPVATLNGDEACALWQHASLQFQATTAVAYALEQYAAVTGDYGYITGDALEMLVEIARYLTSRVGQNPITGKYGFYGVMGPDEFHVMVNNNCYLNYTSKKALEFAANAAENSAYVSAEEIRRWRDIAANMAMPQAKDGVFEQFDGYFSLPNTDINSIPIEEFPLYAHWSYDRIYRTNMLKQPDVLQFMYMYSNDFSEDALRKNYDYYEPRTIHESSLSPSIHSILSARLGKVSEAVKFFGFATRLDLDNYNRNAGEGLHMTSIAAAWMNIVFGFAGLSVDGAEISVKPSLPPSWKRLEFNVKHRGDSYRVTVTADGAEIVKN
ncbi:maltose phosphorylase [Clostridia bacterium]|nr:maltose phosphorylase [Clostridia bacterium]